MNTPASDACQIPLNPDVVATVQDTPASAVVPSREAVEEQAQYLESLGDDGDADMLRTLLAERDEARRTVAQLERERDDALSAAGITHGVYPELYRLRATVADQAAALAERDKDAERLNWLAENVWMWTPPKVDAPYAMVEIWLDSERKFQVGWKDSVGVASLRTAIDAALAASVSSASEEGK